jgi:hypothetical protein
MDLRDIAVAAGVICLWAMFVIMAVMGLSFAAKGRIRVTKRLATISSKPSRQISAKYAFPIPTTPCDQSTIAIDREQAG